MKKTIRIFLRACAAAAVFLNLAACGGTGTDTLPLSEKEYVYKSTSREETSEVKGDFEHFCFVNGTVYYISEYDTEDGHSEFYLNRSDMGGGGFASYPLETRDAYISPPAFETEDTGYYTAVVTEENRRTYSLVKVNGNGRKIKTADITQTVSEHIPDMYPCIFEIIGDNIYMGDYDGIVILDKDGKFVNAVTRINGLSRIISDRNGKAYACIRNGSDYELCGIDVQSGTLESSLSLPFDGYGNVFIGGRGSEYDFFVSDGTSLFGYDTRGDKTELLKWIEAGVSVMEVKDIFYSGDETFICAGKSYPYGYPKFYTVKKQPAEKNEKQEILLAGTEYGIVPLMENSIIKFNSTSDKYHITVKKYPYDKTDEMNLDIISGKIPDILVSDSYVQTDNYISKGLLADMYEFMDRDSEINRSDFVPNLLAACETDGRLYRFPESFKIYTVIGKSSVFGDSMGITADRLNDIAAKYPAGTEIFPASSKEDIIGFAMELSGDEYIDFKKGTCSFDSDGFVSILEFADRFMDSRERDAYFDSFLRDRIDTVYSDESALLMICYLTGYADVYNFERVNFGERVTAVGFPEGNGVGTSFVIDTGLSVSEKSRVKEGAWEFVREIFLPVYQDCADCFPVRKDSLEKAAKAATERDPKRDSYATVLMGDMMIAYDTSGLGEPSREDTDRVNDIISSASGIMTCDADITGIVLEEADGYFGGVRSAKEAAEMIQMRVTLCLGERS